MKKLMLIIIIIPIFMLIFDIPYYQEHFSHEYHCIKYVNGKNTFDYVDVEIEGTISKYLNNEEDVIRYTLVIGDNEYPIKGDHIAVVPYWPETEDIVPIYTAGGLQYSPTNRIELELEYLDDNYEVRIAYSYFDTDKIKSIHIHNGFMILEKDFSNICIGLYPESGYDAHEFPKGIITIVSASRFDEAQDMVAEFWKTLIE